MVPDETTFDISSYGLSALSLRIRTDGRSTASGELAVESRIGDRLATKLAGRGHDVAVLPPGRFGGVRIVRNDAGTLSGATEPRKDGSVVGY